MDGANFLPSVILDFRLLSGFRGPEEQLKSLKLNSNFLALCTMTCGELELKPNGIVAL